jgi:hypothetical protein
MDTTQGMRRQLKDKNCSCSGARGARPAATGHAPHIGSPKKALNRHIYRRAAGGVGDRPCCGTPSPRHSSSPQDLDALRATNPPAPRQVRARARATTRVAHESRPHRPVRARAGGAAAGPALILPRGNNICKTVIPPRSFARRALPRCAPCGACARRVRWQSGRLCRTGPSRAPRTGPSRAPRTRAVRLRPSGPSERSLARRRSGHLG